MEYVFIVLAGILLLAGIIGCFLPILPGPPLCYGGILLMHFTTAVDFSTQTLVILGVIVLVVSLLDYFVPIWGTKKFGGSRKGIIGSVLGLIIGVFFFPPFGIIIGPFVGAIAGELANGDDMQKAVKSGLGSFLGYVFGTSIKLAACLVMAYYYVERLI